MLILELEVYLKPNIMNQQGYSTSNLHVNSHINILFFFLDDVSNFTLFWVSSVRLLLGEWTNQLKNLQEIKLHVVLYFVTAFLTILTGILLLWTISSSEQFLPLTRVLICLLFVCFSRGWNVLVVSLFW